MTQVQVETDQLLDTSDALLVSMLDTRTAEEEEIGTGQDLTLKPGNNRISVTAFADNKSKMTFTVNVVRWVSHIKVTQIATLQELTCNFFSSTSVQSQRHYNSSR